MFWSRKNISRPGGLAGARELVLDVFGNWDVDEEVLLPGELGVPPDLQTRIIVWDAEQAEIDRQQYPDGQEPPAFIERVATHASQGLSILIEIKRQFPNLRVVYFDPARLYPSQAVIHAAAADLDIFDPVQRRALAMVRLDDKPSYEIDAEVVRSGRPPAI